MSDDQLSNRDLRLPACFLRSQHLVSECSLRHQSHADGQSIAESATRREADSVLADRRHFGHKECDLPAAKTSRRHAGLKVVCRSGIGHPSVIGHSSRVGLRSRRQSSATDVIGHGALAGRCAAGVGTVFGTGQRQLPQ